MSPPDAPPRILIVDDEPALSDALAYALQREGLADVDLGFAFLPAHRGHGYAFEAAAAVNKQKKKAINT